MLAYERFLNVVYYTNLPYFIYLLMLRLAGAIAFLFIEHL